MEEKSRQSAASGSETTELYPLTEFVQKRNHSLQDGCPSIHVTLKHLRCEETQTRYSDPLITHFMKKNSCESDGYPSTDTTDDGVPS